MAAAGLPTVQVQLDDVNNGGTWPHDITAYFRLTEGYQVTPRGPGDERVQPTPVTLTLSLDNTDGRFTLGSTVGGYGAINADRGIRIRVIANAVTTTRFTGFVQAWPVDWPAGHSLFSRVQVTAVDAMARWARRPLRSLVEEEMLRDSPAVLYTLGEPEGATFGVDTSGNRANDAGFRGVVLGVSGVPVVFGTSTGPGTDGLPAPTYPVATLGLRVEAVQAVTWMSCWFLATSIGFGGAGLVYWGDAEEDQQLYLSFDGSGFLQASYWNFGTYVNLVYSSVNVADGAGHTAALSFEGGSPGTMKLFLDGNEVASTSVAGPAPNSLGGLNIGQNLRGTIAHVAAGDVADLSDTPGDRFFLYNYAAKVGYWGRFGHSLVEVLAVYEGSAPVRTGDSGLTKFVHQDPSGKSVADAIAQIVDAERGTAFVDGQGRTAFHSRHRGPLTVAAALSVAVNSDMLSPSTAVQADMQQVVNYASGRRSQDDASVTQVVTSKPSSDIHGRYPESTDYLLATDAEVLDRLTWLVETHAEPVPRIPDLVFDLLTADASVQASVMALEVNSRVQITGMPSQSPTGVLADLAVLNYAESLSLNGWEWRANTISWPDLVQAWVLGNATYGQLGITTRLGV